MNFLTRRHAALAVLAALVFGAMVAAWPLLRSKWEAYKYARWQERQIAWFQGDGFATLPPWAHCVWATRLLHPRTTKVVRFGKDTFSGPWIAEPTRDDLKHAIRHLEATPLDSVECAQASELLPLLRLKRDRPQDFLAVEEASYRSCIAGIKAQWEEEREKAAQEHPCHVQTSDGRCPPVITFCGTGVAEECAPLAGSERIAQLRTLVQ